MPNANAQRPLIIATVGPANRQLLGQMLAAGVDIIRTNLSHRSQSWHAELAREAAQLGAPLLLDTRGPELRTGELPAGSAPIVLEKDAEFELVPVGNELQKNQIAADGALFSSEIEKGTRILFGGGEIEARALEIAAESVRARVVHGGKIGSRQHIHLPSARLALPTLTQKDEDDLRYFRQLEERGEASVNMVALSFARSGQDVRRARALVGPKTRIIAKIESQRGLNNATDILDEADGIMVARGDLAVEVSLEKLPMLQRQLLANARQQFPKKFRVVATGILRQMQHSPRPTRAEVSDAATAVWEGADALMLSDEVAVGSHPIVVVETLRRIIQEAATARPFV